MGVLHIRNVPDAFYRQAQAAEAGARGLASLVRAGRAERERVLLHC